MLRSADAYGNRARGMPSYYRAGKRNGDTLPIGLGALGESNQSFRTERYSRRNAVRERDELFAVLRYAF